MPDDNLTFDNAEDAFDAGVMAGMFLAGNTIGGHPAGTPPQITNHRHAFRLGVEVGFNQAVSRWQETKVFPGKR